MEASVDLSEHLATSVAMIRRNFNALQSGRQAAKRRVQRRGVSLVQTSLVLVLIAAAVFFALRGLSTNTATDLEETADGIADPAQLADRFLN
jgi:hypothetical protein